MTTNTYPSRRKQLHIVAQTVRAIPFALALIVCTLICVFGAVCAILALVAVMVVFALLLAVVVVPFAAVVVALLITGFLVPRLGITYRRWAGRFGKRINVGVGWLDKRADKLFGRLDRAFDRFDRATDKVLAHIV